MLDELRKRAPEVPVIILTSHGTIPSAVNAMRGGAFGYLTKPFEPDELLMWIERALRFTGVERENRLLRQEIGSRYGVENVVAESSRSKDLIETLRRVAKSRSTVLVQGESGVGKELVARLIHYWSDRVGHPFVAINCKSFADSVLESELFGHEKGSFTGALAARAGCFERASGGTLFLDEIGEISGEFQSKLLRVLQEGEVLRVGGNQPRKIDTRVVAATNRILREEVRSGRFREDLFFRLNVIPIVVPPLRERREDILPLARLFAVRTASQSGRRIALSAEAERELLAYGWPGNVRELENAIERAVVLARSDVIGPQDLFLDPPVADDPPPAPEIEPEGGTLQEYIDRAAAARLEEALKSAQGNRSEAARKLGIDRAKLYRLLARYKMGREP